MVKPETENRKSKDIIRALMDPSRPDTVPWSSSDLRAMLEHQLAAPLACELLRLAETSRRSFDEVASVVGGLKGATFGQLLENPTPCLEAIELVKDYAKAALRRDGDLPRDVARVLYVMAILRGRQAGYPAISSLDNVNVKGETRRCLTFGWLPDRVQDFLRSASLDQPPP
jgi:hypothetical protein